MYIILVYDIKFDDDGKGEKILPKVFKICKKYLYHIQNSVFEGELTKSEIFKLRKELENVIRKDVDSIIVFQSRNERWLNKEFWGNKEDKTSNFL
ncbi:CRISPR-associated endonuclease Cas2 [Marinitoga lauensis]|uniref:CRISPR-associated endonuclease Cas2 n=1 Tax=Marinitoga lauensis TaxID=2201189 RepID=UPI0010122690|nr:CRISPR-associated endonuclease Cas2 [Marinitoga lauensis]